MIRVWGSGRSARVAALALVAALVAMPAAAQVYDWPSEQPPKPLSAREVQFPPYRITTLANGLQVVAVPHHEQPAVSLRLLIRAGAALDPADKPGVANLVASLLDQGTKDRSAQQIAEAVDSIGGAMGVGAGTDLSFVNAVVMVDDFDVILSLVSNVAQHPAFAAEEIERQRQQVLSGLRVSYEDPDYIADVVFDRLVYGFHAYGRPSSGTPESVDRITREDLVRFHQTYFVPNNAILAVVGDVSPEDAFAGAERAFGSWERRELPERAFDDPPPPTRRVVVIDRPGAVQTEIRVGHLGVARKHSDYLALNLAVKILGGEGANRLHRVLRSERGLTYGASAELDALRLTGAVVAETNTRSETTGEALRLMVDEFSRLRRDRVSERELGGAQDYLAGSFPLTIETPSQIALQVLNTLFYGLDLEELQTFRERVNGVTTQDVIRAAQDYIRPDRLSIVMVGNAVSFASQLAGAGFDRYEVVPLPELDLAAADLRRDPDRAGARAAALRPPVAPEARHRAQELLARMIEAKGGLEKIRSVRTIRAVATTIVTTPQGPMEAETTTYIAYPDRFRVEAQLRAGPVIQIYTAGQAWLRDPNGVREAPAVMRNDFRASTERDMLTLLRGAAEGAVDVRLLPDATGDDGQRLLALEFSSDSLEPITVHVSPGTALVVSQIYVTSGPGGAQIVLEEHFSDYRTIDGLSVAFAAVVRRDGAVVTERAVSHFEVNVPLDPALFAKPS